jgi:hypothetical protein
MRARGGAGPWILSDLGLRVGGGRGIYARAWCPLRMRSASPPPGTGVPPGRCLDGRGTPAHQSTMGTIIQECAVILSSSDGTSERSVRGELEVRNYFGNVTSNVELK